MNAHHAVSTNTHRIFFFFFFNPTVHPGPPYCSGSGAKQIRIFSLPGRFISLFLSFFCLFFPFFSFFFFFFFVPRGVGLFTKSELSMTWHIFLCICYIICCLKILFAARPIQYPAGPSFAEEESPRPTPVGPVRYGRRGCLLFMVVSL